MATKLTPVTVKDLQRLQDTSSYEQARRDLRAIRDSFSAQVAVVYHVALYLGVPEQEVISILN